MKGLRIRSQGTQLGIKLDNVKGGATKELPDAFWSMDAASDVCREKGALSASEFGFLFSPGVIKVC